MNHTIGLGVIAALAALGTHSVANACSPADSTPAYRAVPVADAANYPTNGLFIVGPGAAAPVVKDLAGNNVTLTRDAALSMQMGAEVYRPTPNLMPNSSYRCESGCAGQFSTGGLLDTAGPPAPSITGFSSSTSAAGGGCAADCGNFDYTSFSVVATDDKTAVGSLIAIIYGGATEAEVNAKTSATAATTIGFKGEVDINTGSDGHPVFRPSSDYCFNIAVVDGGGNISPRSAVLCHRAVVADPGGCKVNNNASVGLMMMLALLFVGRRRQLA